MGRMMAEMNKVECAMACGYKLTLFTGVRALERVSHIQCLTAHNYTNARTRTKNTENSEVMKRGLGTALWI